MTAKDAKDALARARRGAKFLDRRRPGWARQVKITKLDMGTGWRTESGCGCVLAQLEGEYIAGLDALGITYADGEDDRFGFDTEDGDYEPLTEAWKSLIRERRHAAA